MKQADFLIIGGGLGGLYAAYALARQGISDYVVLEARNRMGGRVLSVPSPAPGKATDAVDRFDLGPSWFWPDYQPQLDELVENLGLQRFSQPESGDALIERGNGAGPARTAGYMTAPPSKRLVGGMQALVDALIVRLDPDKLFTGVQVNRLLVEADQVQLQTTDATGQACTWSGKRALLALPPRLAMHTLSFTPALPAQLAQQWRDTPTWMAPHAKYVAVYDAPFWTSLGLSGQARSGVGPMVELHDASAPGGHAALFGFIGVPASARQRLSPAELKAHCRAQLVRLFGEQAGTPLSEHLQDWAQEPLTAVSADAHIAGHAITSPPAAPDAGPWRGRLIGIGSEWSIQYSGYLAGAIEAAGHGVTHSLRPD